MLGDCIIFLDQNTRNITELFLFQLLKSSSNKKDINIRFLVLP